MVRSLTQREVLQATRDLDLPHHIYQDAVELFSIMRMRIPNEEEIGLLRYAFVYAATKHRQQKRHSGEPYIIHPLAVARIVAGDMELDTYPVIAALLHDVVEDTDTTIEEIGEEFGEEVQFIVDAVTKKQKERYRASKQIDNFKQILDSVHYDIRALLIKLADRLHNMRTLSSMSPAKQMKIAGETDFFYAPMAGKLGLYKIKSELENLSFRYRCPNEYARIEAALKEEDLSSRNSVDAFTNEIDFLLSSRGFSAHTQVRQRKPYSIWRNMQEEGADFQSVEFKRWIRVIYDPLPGTSEKETAILIYSLLSSVFKERAGSVTNYIDNPKDNGYQSFHVKFLNPSGNWEELHISSERMVKNSRLGCIVERDGSWLERFTTVLKDIADNSDQFALMEGISASLTSEDTLVFTPQGQPVILPKGATALDFAFEMHTEIGLHAKYARINKKLSPLSTELHRGDMVYIEKSDEVDPNTSWMEYVRTYKARKALKGYFGERGASKWRRCRFCHPLPGDAIIGFKQPDGTTVLHSRSCSEVIRQASAEGDQLISVNFKRLDDISYPVRIVVIAVDRFHLLRDVADCLVENFHISLEGLNAQKTEEIVTFVIDYEVHDYNELLETIQSISKLDGVDEVQYTGVGRSTADDLLLDKCCEVMTK